MDKQLLNIQATLKVILENQATIMSAFPELNEKQKTNAEGIKSVYKIRIKDWENKISQNL